MINVIRSHKKISIIIMIILFIIIFPFTLSKYKEYEGKTNNSIDENANIEEV